MEQKQEAQVRQTACSFVRTLDAGLIFLLLAADRFPVAQCSDLQSLPSCE
jgi:hypothetical protein